MRLDDTGDNSGDSAPAFESLRPRPLRGSMTGVLGVEEMRRRPPWLVGRRVRLPALGLCASALGGAATGICGRSDDRRAILDAASNSKGVSSSTLCKVGVWDGVFGADEGSTGFVRKYTPRKVVAIWLSANDFQPASCELTPKAKLTNWEKLSPRNSWYSTALPMMADMEKNTNCVGMTSCLSANISVSAYLRLEAHQCTVQVLDLQHRSYDKHNDGNPRDGVRERLEKDGRE